MLPSLGLGHIRINLLLLLEQITFRISSMNTNHETGLKSFFIACCNDARLPCFLRQIKIVLLFFLNGSCVMRFK